MWENGHLTVVTGFATTVTKCPTSTIGVAIRTKLEGLERLWYQIVRTCGSRKLNGNVLDAQQLTSAITWSIMVEMSLKGSGVLNSEAALNTSLGHVFMTLKHPKNP